MKKTVLLLLALVIVTTVSAQQSINDYKYVVVPNTFGFLKEADEYRLNSLTKFLFEKYNFVAFMEDETPPSDYSKNNCLGLKADVLNDSNMLKTKLAIQLKNCKNEVIFTSAQGESRDKSYKISYNQALRSAFKSFETVNYSYKPKPIVPSSNTKALVEASQEEIVKLKEEIKVLKETKKETIIESVPEVVLPKVKENKTEVNKIKETTVLIPNTDNSRLRAEAITNNVLNYNLFNSNGDKVYTILFSGKADLYIVKDKDAVIYKLNDKWIIAESIDNTIQITALDIKF